MKKSFKKTQAMTILAVGALALQACGGAPYSEISSIGGSSTTSTGSGSTSTGTGSGTPSTGGGTTPAPSDPNLLPPISHAFSNQGVTSTSISDIVTDNKLAVTVKLGQPSNIPNTGYTAAYRCARINVTVANQTQTVFVSNTGADITESYDPCSGAKKSQTVDFSSRLTTGHGAMSVAIQNVAYDNCRLYGNVYGSGCFLTTVYSTHVINGTIDVHVNGTN